MMRKPKGSRYVVDFYNPDDPEPMPGDIMQSFSHTGEHQRFWRILSVRKVKVRVSRGEAARYALRLHSLPEIPEGSLISFTTHSHPPKPRKRNPVDPLDMLLPPLD